MSARFTHKILRSKDIVKGKVQMQSQSNTTKHQKNCLSSIIRIVETTAEDAIWDTNQKPDGSSDSGEPNRLISWTKRHNPPIGPTQKQSIHHHRIDLDCLLWSCHCPGFSFHRSRRNKGRYRSSIPARGVAAPFSQTKHPDSWARAEPAISVTHRSSR